MNARSGENTVLVLKHIFLFTRCIPLRPTVAARWGGSVNTPCTARRNYWCSAFLWTMNADMRVVACAVRTPTWLSLDVCRRTTSRPAARNSPSAHDGHRRRPAAKGGHRLGGYPHPPHGFPHAHARPCASPLATWPHPAPPPVAAAAAGEGAGVVSFGRSGWRLWRGGRWFRQPRRRRRRRSQGRRPRWRRWRRPRRRWWRRLERWQRQSA